MSEIERLREALEKIAQVGDGYGPRKPGSGTTGEGHARCLEIADAALAATPPGAERGEWKGIETAPRDETQQILLWICSRGSVRRGTPEICWWDRYCEEWRRCSNREFIDNDAPTHWCELPAPPSPPASEGEK